MAVRIGHVTAGNVLRSGTPLLLLLLLLLLGGKDTTALQATVTAVAAIVVGIGGALEVSAGGSAGAHHCPGEAPRAFCSGAQWISLARMRGGGAEWLTAL
eukprot:scaffold167659_cov21-Tisochrysis_lutea.AAC.2